MIHRLFVRFIYAVLILFGVQGLENIWAQEEGMASYYHSRFHGRKSSSGRVHSQDELIAAHRTHPFGTFLRVTNLANMNSVIVCVTDRGPHRRNRILDVSEAAADILGFRQSGIARVRIEVVPSMLDLRYLDLIYPKIPYLDTEALRVQPPYKFSFKVN